MPLLSYMSRLQCSGFLDIFTNKIDQLIVPTKNLIFYLSITLCFILIKIIVSHERQNISANGKNKPKAILVVAANQSEAELWVFGNTGFCTRRVGFGSGIQPLRKKKRFNFDFCIMGLSIRYL